MRTLATGETSDFEFSSSASGLGILVDELVGSKNSSVIPFQKDRDNVSPQVPH